MSDSELAVLAPQTFPAPILIERAGPSTRKRFFEFFTVPIRNANTRAAYYRAIQQFLAWGTSSLRARWAKPLAMPWPNGSLCRYICMSPKSRSSLIGFARTKLSRIDEVHVIAADTYGVYLNLHVMRADFPRSVCAAQRQFTFAGGTTHATTLKPQTRLRRDAGRRARTPSNS